MIINDEDALKRLSSPMNLINRLRRENGNGNSSRKSAMSLFGLDKNKIEIKKESSFNPFQAAPASSESLAVQSKETQPQPTSNLTAPPAGVQQPTLSNILENHESQIKLGLAHDNALALLNRSVDMLAAKLDDIRADKLPTVVSAASKVVEGIRKERSEAAKNQKDREVHYHFYTPQQKTISDYEVIDVEAAPAS